MTNEELVLLIKQGNNEHLPELWENVKRLIYMLAFEQYRANSDTLERAGLALEDIQQEGYFAMLGAIEAYKPEKGFAFTSYLHLQLKTCIRSLLKPGDLLNRAETGSLDAALDDEDPDSESLHDIIADPDSGKAIAAFEQRNSYNILYEAISLLPGELKKVIKLHFFEGLTLDQIGERLGKSRERIRQIESNALGMMRRGPLGRKLKNAYFDEIKSNSAGLSYHDIIHRHKGLNAFKSSQSSIIEDNYFKRQQAIERYSKQEITREEFLEIMLAILKS